MENHAQDNQVQAKKKEVVFLITVSLRDAVTFTFYNTELLVAYFIPMENTQPQRH